MSYVVPFEQLRMTDVDSVGGKNASLGEMISQLTGAGVRVPGGFATTAEAFRAFLKASGLDDRIHARLATLNAEDVRELAAAGAEIRQWVIDAPFPADFESAVRTALRRVEEEVLRDHVAHCVEGAIASGDRVDQRRKVAELMEVFSRAER